MKNLATFQNNNLVEDNENLYLYFTLGDNKYALGVQQVVEIMKLPLLDYPQRLPNNFVGLLNYNNFTINVLDLRFYLDIKVTPYSVANQLLVVKTDEALWGLLIDKVEDIISLEQSQIEHLQFSKDFNIIDFLYRSEQGTISVVNLDALEEVIKQGVLPNDVDIPALFPHDDDSRYKLVQRNQALDERFQLNLVSNIFSQDKFISFSSDNSLYCINLNYVKEFLKNSTITNIPCDLDYIAGVITLRGEFVTVIDFKNFFNPGISTKVNLSEGKNNIIIIETSDFVIGFLVDEIFSIIEIPEEKINENVHYQLGKHIMSEVILEDKLYSILNIKTLLSDDRLYVEDNG